MPEPVVAPLPRTVRLLDRGGRVIAEIGTVDARSQVPIALGAMGEWLPRVTVAIEDWRFDRHGGVDWVSVGGALLRGARAGRPVGGASTITQQYVKLTLGAVRRGLLSKAREILIAAKLECAWGKHEILKAYLNRLDYGNRLIGPESAARVYFGKPACELTLAEAAYLAGLPQSPARRNPWAHPDSALSRYRVTLERLTALGVIDADACRRHGMNPPEVRRDLPGVTAPHFVRAAFERLDGACGEHRTTLDLELQGVAEGLVRAHLARVNRHDVSAAALVIVDVATGGVRALVGSPDFARSQIDGARARRSCGSILKPFVYLMGIDRRLFTAATILPDTADAISERYSDYDPQNHTGRFLGPVRVRQALACSLNVPAVDALGRVGPRRAFQRLREWGVDFGRDYDTCGAGFILGNAEVTLLSVTGAYAGLARGGLARAPRLLEREQPAMRRMSSPEAAWILCDILRDDQARAPAFGVDSPLAGGGGRFAAKTGTSSGFRDAWTIGFDRAHAVGVWVGNFDGRPMGETLAIRVAAPLWRAMMDHLLRRDEPLEDAPPGEGVVRREICPLTGLRPSSRGPAPVSEWFLAGTEPLDDASAWLEPRAGGGVTLLLPPAFAAWCAGPHNHIGARCATVGPLRILHPKPGAQFELDAVLPPEQQMIRLRSNRDGRVPVQWSIGGRTLVAGRDGVTLWPLVPGQWLIEAQAGGETARTSFRVAPAR